MEAVVHAFLRSCLSEGISASAVVRWYRRQLPQRGRASGVPRNGRSSWTTSSSCTSWSRSFDAGTSSVHLRTSACGVVRCVCFLALRCRASCRPIMSSRVIETCLRSGGHASLSDALVLLGSHCCDLAPGSTAWALIAGCARPDNDRR